MARPDIRHKRMRVGDLPPQMRHGDPDEMVDVYENVADPIFRRIPRLTDDVPKPSDEETERDVDKETDKETDFMAKFGYGFQFREPSQ